MTTLEVVISGGTCLLARLSVVFRPVEADPFVSQPDLKLGWRHGALVLELSWCRRGEAASRVLLHIWTLCLPP